MYVKVNNELYHHGIVGQKWGTRNGPPYPLGYSKHSPAEKKAMSKEEKYRAKAVDRVSFRYGQVAKGYDKRQHQLEKKRSNMEKNFYEKLDKYNQSGDEEKAVKLTNAYSKKYDKVSNKIALADIGKNLCNNLLEKEIGHIQTMDVGADKKQRGKELATAIITSAVGTAVVNVGFALTGTPAVGLIATRTSKESRLTKEDINESAKYAGAEDNFKDTNKVIDNVINKTTNFKGKNVRKDIERLNRLKEEDDSTKAWDKYRDRISNEAIDNLMEPDTRTTDKKRISSSEKAEAMNRARTKNMYAVNFMEAIQNSKIMWDDNVKEINKEYSIYLDDPEAYWDRARKLEQA